MAAEFLNNAVQSVNLYTPIILNSSIPCRKGWVYHEDETGTFKLRGCTNQCFATYQVVFNANIALPEGATVTPIAVGLTVDGEQRVTSRAIFTPSAVQEWGNITSTAIIKVPKCDSVTLAVENIPASNLASDTPAPVIEVQNANLTISRIA